MQAEKSLPRMALTMGDPAGIGPEVIAAAWASPIVHEICRPFVIGHPETMTEALALRKVNARVERIHSPEESQPSSTVMPCLAIESDASQAPRCEASAAGGQAAYEAVVAAAQLAIDQRIDAMVTAPLHKGALHMAGHYYPGHTELLAELCGVDDFAMMLYLGHDEIVRPPAGLAVVHVTLHTSMRNVLETLDGPSILAKIRLADSFMQKLKGDEPPRIGVTAFNPHAGEDGLFGDEEIKIIAPAVQQARDEDILAEGPFPADTLLLEAKNGRFDAVVAMYHDQGHIALKMIGMHRAVNVTLGLPIVRTSVAHGTAFDRAWQATANENSMIEAVRVAAVLAGKQG